MTPRTRIPAFRSSLLSSRVIIILNLHLLPIIIVVVRLFSFGLPLVLIHPIVPSLPLLRARQRILAESCYSALCMHRRRWDKAGILSAQRGVGLAFRV